MYDQIKIPSAPELEQAVIGAVLHDRQLLRDAELTPGHFYDEDHAEMWKRITAIDKEHRAADINTIIHHFQDNVALSAKVTLLFKHPDTFAFNDNVGILKQLAVQRGAIDLFYNKLQSLQQTDLDPYPLLNDASVSIMELMQNDVRKDAVEGEEFMDSAFKSIQKAQDGNLGGLDTGFDALDKLLGPILPGLIIIAARPSMGKSSFAIKLFNYWTVDKGIPGAFFSLEMCNDQVGRWMIAQLAGIKNNKMKEPGGLNEKDLKQITDTIYKISSSPVCIDDSTGYNILQLRSKAVRLKQQYDIKFMIVDYIQLLMGVDTKGKIRNRENEVAEISRGLKLLSKELNIPVFALCQMNRAIDTRHHKIPVLSDLRESGAIEQDADIVLFIHRPEKYGENEYRAGGVSYSTEGLAAFPVRKNRDGETGEALLRFDPEYVNFETWNQLPQMRAEVLKHYNE